MVAPALWTVIREVMDHLSKPQWPGFMALICPDQFLQLTTGFFLQLLLMLSSVLLDFCFLKYSFDITYLFQSLPSSLLSLKVSQSPQRHTKNPHPAHFTPLLPCADLYATCYVPSCPPFRECSLTSMLIQKNVKQIFGGGEKGIHRGKKWGVFNKILESSFSWHLLGHHPCKDEAERTKKHKKQCTKKNKEKPEGYARLWPREGRKSKKNIRNRLPRDVGCPLWELLNLCPAKSKSLRGTNKWPDLEPPKPKRMGKILHGAQSMALSCLHLQQSSNIPKTGTGTGNSGSKAR